jgi:hypothetical protein
MLRLSLIRGLLYWIRYNLWSSRSSNSQPSSPLQASVQSEADEVESNSNPTQSDPSRALERATCSVGSLKPQWWQPKPSTTPCMFLRCLKMIFIVDSLCWHWGQQQGMRIADAILLWPGQDTCDGMALSAQRWDEWREF